MIHREYHFRSRARQNKGDKYTYNTGHILSHLRRWWPVATTLHRGRSCSYSRIRPTPGLYPRGARQDRRSAMYGRTRKTRKWIPLTPVRFGWWTHLTYITTPATTILEYRERFRMVLTETTLEPWVPWVLS